MARRVVEEKVVLDLLRIQFPSIMRKYPNLQKRIMKNGSEK